MREKKKFWIVFVVALLVGVGVLATLGIKPQSASCSESWCPSSYTGPEQLCHSDGYEDGHCTCYAWKRASSSAAWNNWFPENLGHAYQWDDRADDLPHNYSVGTIPYPSSIAVWEEYVRPIGGGWYVSRGGGHVAYVESTVGDSFTVSHMNYGDCGGCDLRHCVIGSTFNNANFYEGDLHFIYPPSDVPVQLWPYPGLKVEYGDSIVLRWYGNADYC